MGQSSSKSPLQKLSKLHRFGASLGAHKLSFN